jgi:hypothetical protein
MGFHLATEEHPRFRRRSCAYAPALVCFSDATIGRLVSGLYRPAADSGAVNA